MILVSDSYLIGTIHKFEDFDQYVGRSANGSKCCGLCFNFESNHPRDLRNHIEARHFPDTFTYQCPECNKRFVQSSHVNYHMKTVHAPPDTFRPKNHACTECGARFGTASTLRKHFRTHTGKQLILYAEL